MAKELATKRKFGDKTFVLFWTFDTRAQARSVALRMQSEQGYQTRIVKHKAGYTVYRRYVKGKR